MPPGDPLVSTPFQSPRPPVEALRLVGRTVDLEQTDAAAHGPGLWQGIGIHPHLWDGIPSAGPFDNAEAFQLWLDARLGKPDQAIYTVIDKTGGEPRPAGLLFVLKIAPVMGTAELGLVYGPALIRAVGGTEAFYLLTRHILGDLGYRRWEWRTSCENTASSRAALRFGFTHEGCLRQAMWIKGHNWDTEVYSLLDHEWPAVEARLAAWLDPANFTADGRQIRALAQIGS